MADERVYRTMNSVGVWSLVLGIITIVVGVFTGVTLITNGGRLLKKKSEILF